MQLICINTLKKIMFIKFVKMRVKICAKHCPMGFPWLRASIWK